MHTDSFIKGICTYASRRREGRYVGSIWFVMKGKNLMDDIMELDKDNKNLVGTFLEENHKSTQCAPRTFWLTRSMLEEIW